jgi:tetratricopeptide (TPR) repeat protein
MGVSTPTPPGDDPHAEAYWSDASTEVLLEQARAAAAGGDLPRARSLADGLLRRELGDAEQVETWDLRLEIAVLAGDHDEADEAVDQLAARLPLAQARQRIRMLWVRHRADVTWEIALLARAEASAGAAVPAPLPDESEGALLGSRYRMRPGSDVAGDQGDPPPPAGSVRRLLEALGDEDDDEGGDAGEPDPDSVRLFTDGPPLYEADELRSPVEGARAAALIREDEDGGDSLPLLADTELASRSPQEIHRVVAEHPGASGRDLLRRYAMEQARLTSPAELQHTYDMAVEIFGQERYEEAAHLLLPVATVDNPERLGALELLARALFELGRLPQAEAYLKEAVPVVARITDASYGPLFYWLGRIREEKDDPGSAMEYYASAVKLAPEIVEARRRLQALIAL